MVASVGDKNGGFIDPKFYSDSPPIKRSERATVAEGESFELKPEGAPSDPAPYAYPLVEADQDPALPGVPTVRLADLQASVGRISRLPAPQTFDGQTLDQLIQKSGTEPHLLPNGQPNFTPVQEKALNGFYGSSPEHVLQALTRTPEGNLIIPPNTDLAFRMSFGGDPNSISPNDPQPTKEAADLKAYLSVSGFEAKNGAFQLDPKSGFAEAARNEYLVDFKNKVQSQLDAGLASPEAQVVYKKLGSKFVDQIVGEQKNTLSGLSPLAQAKVVHDAKVELTATANNTTETVSERLIRSGTLERRAATPADLVQVDKLVQKYQADVATELQQFVKDHQSFPASTSEGQAVANLKALGIDKVAATFAANWKLGTFPEGFDADFIPAIAAREPTQAGAAASFAERAGFKLD